MRYGKIESGFWQNPKTKNLSEAARLLLLYIYSCPHGNLVGCFTLYDGYIAADLGWTMERVSKHVSELVSERLIERCESSFLVRIIGWFDHNSIDNANMAKAALRVVLTLPKSEIKNNLLNELNELGNTFLNSFRNELQNEYRTQKQEQKQEQKDTPPVVPPDEKLICLPHDILPPEWAEWAMKDRGWSQSIVIDVWTGFHEYWNRGKAVKYRKADWPATWRNWCRKERIQADRQRQQPQKQFVRTL